MSEFEKASKLVERFLGISWGHLCPQFGFNHNSQHLLFLEAITSFLCFHGLLALARCASQQFQQSEQGRAKPDKQDASLQELEKFSTMIDRTLATMSQVEAGASATASTAATQVTAPESSAVRTQERPKDLESLREEFQQRIAAVKTKWERVPEEPKPMLPEPPDETDEFHLTAATGVLYWAVQAILCCVVLCSIGFSMLGIADGGVWPHYCLLIYAVSNSGLLPTGCLGLTFVVDWFVFEGITTLPVHDLAPEEPLYQSPDGQAMLPQRPKRTASEIRKHQATVDDLRPKFALLCVPEVVPLAFMLMTHTIPFFFMFLWLSILVLALAYGVIALVREGVKLMVPKPRTRILRQTQVLMFLVYLFTTMYVHTSVQVMTRVYAGEWRHGGFFDSLWWHLIIDQDKLSQCPWFNPIRLIDFPLRWT